MFINGFVKVADLAGIARTAGTMGKRYGKQAVNFVKRNPIKSTIGAAAVGTGIGATMAGKSDKGS